jgi:hypothetical protein
MLRSTVEYLVLCCSALFHVKDDLARNVHVRAMWSLSVLTKCMDMETESLRFAGLCSLFFVLYLRGVIVIVIAT